MLTGPVEVAFSAHERWALEPLFNDVIVCDLCTDGKMVFSHVVELTDAEGTY